MENEQKHTPGHEKELQRELEAESQRMDLEVAEDDYQCAQGNPMHEPRQAQCKNWYQAIVDLSAGWDEEGSLGPKDPYTWETVGRLALDYAKAGLRAESQADTSTIDALRAEVERLREALANILPLFNMAFDAEGDVFGMRHNDAVDADISARAALNGGGK